MLETYINKWRPPSISNLIILIIHSNENMPLFSINLPNYSCVKTAREIEALFSSSAFVVIHLRCFSWEVFVSSAAIIDSCQTIRHWMDYSLVLSFNLGIKEFEIWMFEIFFIETILKLKMNLLMGFKGKSVKHKSL